MYNIDQPEPYYRFDCIFIFIHTVFIKKFLHIYGWCLYIGTTYLWNIQTRWLLLLGIAGWRWSLNSCNNFAIKFVFSVSRDLLIYYYIFIVSIYFIVLYYVYLFYCTLPLLYVKKSNLDVARYIFNVNVKYHSWLTIADVYSLHKHKKE